MIYDPSKKVLDHFLEQPNKILILSILSPRQFPISPSSDFLSRKIRRKLHDLQFFPGMNYRRDSRASRSSLFDGYDGLEEGGIRASSSYSHNINEQENDKAIESLQDRVGFLKKLTGDIHEEVESHNRLLDRMGSGMDGSRGMMLGTMDRFKKVFEKKSTRKTCSLVAYFTASFLFIYYLIRLLGYFTLG